MEVGDGVSGVLAFPVLPLPPSHRAPKRVPFAGVGAEAHGFAVSSEEREKSSRGVFPPPDAAADSGLATWVWQGDDAWVAGDCGVDGHCGTGVLIASPFIACLHFARMMSASSWLRNSPLESWNCA